ncbi:MAG: class I SAM-dependent methyltransferase [Planctomycetota bacterium]|jgi:SAM-dependent methyltransferase
MSMSLKHKHPTLEKIKELYTKNLSSYGPTAKSVGWKDQKSHHIRFEKLTQVIDKKNLIQPVTVNDFGCGFGEMFKYIDLIAKINLKKYYGYDISREMLEAATKYIKDGRAEWINSDIISQEADYSFVSGTFNVRFKEDDFSWRDLIVKKLQEISAKSKKGFAFNLLSTYVDWMEPNLYYGDPFFFFDYCKRNFSPYVSLLHDYPLYEWTILVKISE